MNESFCVIYIRSSAQKKPPNPAIYFEYIFLSKIALDYRQRFAAHTEQQKRSIRAEGSFITQESGLPNFQKQA